jgi:hypothetical protein
LISLCNEALFETERYAAVVIASQSRAILVEVILGEDKQDDERARACDQCLPVQNRQCRLLRGSFSLHPGLTFIARGLQRISLASGGVMERDGDC